MKKPSLRIAYDYISLNFGQGRVFTCNRSGEKGTNLSDEVFDLLCAYVKEGPGNYGQRLAMLQREIDFIWPDWNKPPAAFAPGDNLLVGLGSKTKPAVYVEKRKSNIAIKMDGRVVVCSPHLCRLA